MYYFKILCNKQSEWNNNHGVYLSSLQGDEQEIAVIRDVLSGDIAAFEYIIKKHKDYIYRICYSYTYSEEDAEDATQEIFIRVFKSLHTFRLENSFQPWLISIALNHLKTKFFQKQRHSEKMKAAAELMQDSAEEASQTFEDSEKRLKIQSAIAQLPQKYREPVILYYIETMSVQEITKILSISISSVKTRLYRGRKLLRKMLSDL